MTHSEELLLSLDKSWKQVSAAWKKARTKTSEGSVHDLRVSTRRLIAMLDMTQALSKDNHIPKLQRRFKKVLKRMGPVRDVQVQLGTVSRLRQAGLVQDFKRTLEKRERRAVSKIRKQLVKPAKRRLSAGVKDVRSEFTRVQRKLNDDAVHRSIERTLKARRNDFLTARRRFQPADEDTLHQMRIALKKYRYSVEAALPVLANSAKERAREMQAFQKLLGDTRDVELLRAELERWAAKRGKKIAAVPVLDRLTQKREDLLKKINDSAASFEHTFESEKLRPAMENTHAAGAVLNVENPRIEMETTAKPKPN
jgi:CHAD domain-containing protein